MSNGFILLPIMLSMCGPTDDVGHYEGEEEEEGEEIEMKE
jgi:hypothetical protein